MPEHPNITSRLSAGNRSANKWTITQIQTSVKDRLSLPYEPERWQAAVILHLLQGEDSIANAGTGRGKSLVWEGYAAMRPGWTVVVVEPLKSIEADMLVSAQEKDLNALIINEDTTKEIGPKIWLLPTDRKKDIRLLYISPEMALSSSFQKLLNTPKFRKRLALCVVDEAHCVPEWGGTYGFRPDYGKAGHSLRAFMGFDVPLFACSATMDTDTFDAVWKSLKYGSRPFWGVDVGTSRPDLTYILRKASNVTNPLLDILSFLPLGLDKRSSRDDLPKTLIFEFSHEDCKDLKDFLRICLPNHLRNYIQVYTGDVSAPGKEITWRKFRDGEIRIIVATASAAMGCNIPDIDLVIVNGARVKSLSEMLQKFGRAARDRQRTGQAVLLVPGWMYRPKFKSRPNLSQTVTAGVRGNGSSNRKRSGLAPRAGQAVANGIEGPERSRRAKLAPSFERVINLQHETADSNNVCVHAFVNQTMRPNTGLRQFSDLECCDRIGLIDESRSKQTHFQSSWVVLSAEEGLGEIERAVATDCCSHCHPESQRLASMLSPHQLLSQLTKFNNSPEEKILVRSLIATLGRKVKKEFQDHEQSLWRDDRGCDGSQSESDSGTESIASTSQSVDNEGLSQAECQLTAAEFATEANLIPGRSHVLMDSSRTNLCARLQSWSENKLMGSQGSLSPTDIDRSWSFSPRFILSTKMLKNAEKNCGYFVGDNHPVTSRVIQVALKWDLATEDELAQVTDIVHDWASTVIPLQSPRKGDKRKKARTLDSPWSLSTPTNFGTPQLSVPSAHSQLLRDFTDTYMTPSYSSVPRRILRLEEFETEVPRITANDANWQPPQASFSITKGDARNPGNGGDPFTNDWGSSQETIGAFSQGSDEFATVANSSLPSTSQSAKQWNRMLPTPAPSAWRSTNQLVMPSGPSNPPPFFEFEWVDCSPASALQTPTAPRRRTKKALSPAGSSRANKENIKP